MTYTFDAIIIGGGASGSYCAIHAAARGLRVCLLEHNRDIGAKIRVSGGGRCNYTNLHLSAEAYHGHNPAFVRSALARHNQWQVLDWFAARGITAEEKHQGQIFAAERARGILTALHDGLTASGVHPHHHIAIHSQHYDGDRYCVETSHGDFRAPQLVIACGGPSYPKLGASDYALRVAKQYGIRNYPFRPALVPLTLATPPVGLVGISHEVSITTAGAPSFRDDLLYTHRGISGPAVLQISSYRQKDVPILINHLPDLPADYLLARKRAHPQHNLAHALRPHLPKAVADHLAAAHGNRDLHAYSDAALRDIMHALQHQAVVISGSEGMNKAEVSSGGVDTRELDPKTFAVKKQPGLFIVGEALDVTGWLGGYNLQWAWSSAWCCAQHLGDAA